MILRLEKQFILSDYESFLLLKSAKGAL